MKLSRYDKIALVIYGVILLAVFVVMPATSPYAGSSFFHWPTGSVWSNLLASVILGGAAIFGLFRKLERHHREHLEELRKQHVTTRALMTAHHELTLKALRKSS